MTGTTEVKKTVREEVEAVLGDRQELTMYGLAGVLSTLLGGYVREQQMYNYRRNRLIKVNPQGRVLRADAVDFCVKFVEKRRK